MISSACSQLRGRPRHRPLRAQPRAARRSARCPTARTVLQRRHPRPGVGPRPRSASTSSTRSSTGSPSRPSTCRPTSTCSRGRTGQYVFISSASAYQTPAGAAADRRVHAAAQPVLAVLAGQDRVRGAAGRAPTARTASRRRSCGPRTPTTARSCRSTAAGPSSSADAPGQGGRRPRRRHLAVDADPPRRLRQGASSACSATRRRSATASTSPPTRC